MLAPLIGEMAGIEQVAAEWRQSDGTLRVRFGDLDRCRGQDVPLRRSHRACAAHQRVPPGQHHPDSVAGDKIKGRCVRHQVRRHRHQRLQRALRLVGVTAPAHRAEARRRCASHRRPSPCWVSPPWPGPGWSPSPGTWATASAPWACRCGSSCAMWSLMMTAMMLPAVAPVAALYVRTFRSNRPSPDRLFVAGYLLMWAAAGSRLSPRSASSTTGSMDSPTAMRAIAVVVLVLAGVYQLTPLKAVCLRHCRSPLGQLLHYGNIKGPTRDLKVALHHGGYCLGCCWALMALFIAFGVMNIWAMLARCHRGQREGAPPGRADRSPCWAGFPRPRPADRRVADRRRPAGAVKYGK